MNGTKMPHWSFVKAPKTLTALTKDLVQNKNATSSICSAAGVTLATGEGGNAFGDRIFIRSDAESSPTSVSGERVLLDANQVISVSVFDAGLLADQPPALPGNGECSDSAASHFAEPQATAEECSSPRNELP